MKILILVPNLAKTGGIEKYSTYLLQVLGKLGQEVRVLELKKTNLFWKLIFVWQVAKVYLLFRADIIFCGHVNFSPLCLFLNKLFKANYIVFTHGIDVWDLSEGIKKRALKKALKIVTVSTFTKNKLLKQIPQLEKNIFLLPNTVNGNRFHILKEKPKHLVERYSLANKKIIFTLARLSKQEGYKGYDNVIKALPEVLKSVPEAVYIVGGSGDDLPRVRKLVEEFGIKDKVIFAGFIPDNELVDYYNLCDVFVMPSKKEGFGIVFLEALACGKPVIAGNQDGSVDALQNGKVGILVNPDNKDEIGQAIVDVLLGRVEKRLTDAAFLREKTLAVYGLNKFQSKVQNLLYTIQSNDIVSR